MRRTLAQVVIVALVLIGTGYVATATEVVTDCAVSSFEYPDDFGYATPDQAVIAETALDVDGTEVGVNEVDGPRDLTLVTIEEQAEGYLATGLTSCDTDTVFGPAPANAHTVGDYFDVGGASGLETWPGANPDITVHFTANVPTAARTAIRNGWEIWETDTATVGWSVGGERTNDAVDFSCPQTEENEVHWNEDLGGLKVARATYCTGGGDVISFAVAFDSVNYSWCTSGTCDAGPGYDLMAYGTHEFGHVMGFDGHFPSGDCTGTTRPTMCANPGDVYGHEQRSLNFHDVHTTEAAYD